MKKTYTSPSLVEYGTAYDLTLGTTGISPDLILVDGELITNPDNPNCDNNGDPYLSYVPNMY